MLTSPAPPTEEPPAPTAAEQAARSPLLRALVATYLVPPGKDPSRTAGDRTG